MMMASEAERAGSPATWEPGLQAFWPMEQRVEELYWKNTLSNSDTSLLMP